LQQPARFLQLGAHGGMAGIAPDEARVALVEAHSGQGGRVDFHGPAVLGAPHEYIRHHVFGRARADRGAGPGMTGAYERQGAGEVLVADPKLPLDDGELAAGDALQVVTSNLDRSLEPRNGRVELPQLQLDALADRPGADSGWIQGLNAGKR